MDNGFTTAFLLSIAIAANKNADISNKINIKN